MHHPRRHHRHAYTVILSFFVFLTLLLGLGIRGFSEEAVLPPGETPPPVEEKLSDERVAPDMEDCGFALPQLDPAMAANLREDQKVKLTSFTVRFQQEETDLALMATHLMPGETLELTALAPEGAEAEFVAASEHGGGDLENLSGSQWRWKAPAEPGHHCLQIGNKTTGESFCLNVFVKRPYKGEKALNGYQIGAYQKLPLNNDPAYNMPAGFIEVTPEIEDMWVTPHFQLRQFMSKQKSKYPKYVLIHPRLLQKLELLLEEVRERGIDARSFYVVSAFRTPHYNFSIGNRTSYSRHSYGDAADIMVVREEDMKKAITSIEPVKEADARHLHGIVEELHEQEDFKPFVGGLGIYKANPHRPAFIHVDTRGHRVRW